ncbi:MAG: type 1 glutamine amidotransferase [Rhodobacteraceae bacterium]|nr:type 1 glutamine amidotransferase [Paracoccaceae bacterium]
MHIAILLTSNDKSEFAQRFPDDGEKFRKLLASVRPEWRYRVVRVAEMEFPENLDEFDGFVITGSPASVNDELPWIEELLDLIVSLHRKQRPVFGCCFGHQAIAKALGGRVGYNPGDGWSLGISRANYSIPMDWMPECQTHIDLYAAHSEQVHELPIQAISIASSTGCPCSAFVVGNHIMTTQYHPEMSEEFMRQLIDHLSEELTANQGNRFLEQLRKPAQGAEFGAWITRFLESAHCRGQQS